MVEPREIYNASKVFYPQLPEWDDLPLEEKDKWQRMADETNAKDMDGVDA